MKSNIVSIVGPNWTKPDLSLVLSREAPAPDFPTEILGAEWANWCGEVAQSTTAPVDYVGASLMATAAALIGNSRTASFGSWSQPSTIWCALVGPPSAKKSPAMAPLKNALGILEAELVPPVVVEDARPPQLRVGDVTAHAAAEVASFNPNGLLLQREELSGWWEQINRNGGEGFWLEAYDAGSYTVNRKGKAALQIARLNISVLGTAQPDPVRGLLEAKTDRGFAARYLYVYPEPTRGFRRPTTVDQTLATAALRRLRDLCIMESPTQPCPLSGGAEDVADIWLSALDDRTHKAEGLWQQWLGKQAGMLLRYALVFEHLWWSMVDDGEPPSMITAAAINAAATFIDAYAMPMAARTFNLAARPLADRHAASLARLLHRHQVGEFNARDVRRGALGPVGPLSEPNAMEGACEALEASALIRKCGVRAGGTKGRAPANYEVNPRLLSAAAHA